MYAQCPECLTFFHLKPAHLKAAGGRVRCSRCKHVFNALETLRDELSPEDLAAAREARRREPKADAPLLNEEYVGDLFDGLEYTENAELGLAEPAGAGTDARDAAEREALSRAAGPPVEPEVHADELAAPGREVHGFAPPARRRHPALLAAANLVLLLALAAQVVHWQRFTLLEHELAGPWLARAYAALGLDLDPPRDLAALKVSRTEVSSHPEHPRALHLTAVLENTAPRAQPWPALRVDLEDRWGDTVGARYFKPTEYLREPERAGDVMSPRARFGVELAIVDPGSAAVGFQVEPCFANGMRYVCRSDIAN